MERVDYEFVKILKCPRAIRFSDSAFLVWLRYRKSPANYAENNIFPLFYLFIFVFKSAFASFRCGQNVSNDGPRAIFSRHSVIHYFDFARGIRSSSVPCQSNGFVFRPSAEISVHHTHDVKIPVLLYYNVLPAVRR